MFCNLTLAADYWSTTTRLCPACRKKSSLTEAEMIKTPFFNITLLVIALHAINYPVQASMVSTSYTMPSTVISGSGGAMNSASYSMVFTLGQPTPSGVSSSPNYRADSGYWYTMLLQIVAGDGNGDEAVDLKDAITALQVTTGQTPEGVFHQADINSDGKIGLIEALKVIRDVADY